jgi:hypothetical protein
MAVVDYVRQVLLHLFGQKRVLINSKKLFESVPVLFFQATD